MDDHFGKGQWNDQTEKGAFKKIQKWGDRAFEDPKPKTKKGC